jgi:hypothetical protein
MRIRFGNVHEKTTCILLDEFYAFAGDEPLQITSSPRKPGRAQLVDATLACSLLAGVSKPRIFRGR